MSISFSSPRVVGAAAAVAAVAALAGCGEAGGPKQTETRTYEVTDMVDAIRVNSGGGQIDIVAGGTGSVRVTEVLRYRTRKPAPQHAVRGSELRFTSGCEEVTDNCGVDYRIEVPATVAARAESGGGGIGATALSGPIDVESGGGKVRGSGITSASFVARTGGGAVDVQFTASPDNVGIESGGGDVTLRLSKETYAVSASAGGGRSTIDVPVDGTSRRKITLSSGGGDIAVTA